MTNTTTQRRLRRIAAALMLSVLALTGTAACNDEGEEGAPGVEEGAGEEED